MDKYKFIIFLFLLLIIIGGCVSTSLPDYEIITSAEQPGIQYIARHIKITLDTNSTVPYLIELLKKEEVVGQEEFFITFLTIFTDGKSNHPLQGESLIFTIDGGSLMLTQNETFERSVTTSNPQYFDFDFTIEQNKFFYKISKDQISKIANGKNIIVNLLTEQIDYNGKLLQKDINRFKIFLEKFGDT